MKQRHIFAALAVVSALVLAVGGTRLSSRRERRTRIAYPPILASLPVFIAQERGFFDKQGLQVDTVSFTSSNEMVSALATGQVDVLPAVSLVPLIHLEIQHPGKVRVFSHSRMRRENSTYRIVVKSSSPARSLRDLEGGKIGVFPGTSATRLLSAYLQRKGVVPGKITFVQLPPSAQAASLESGAVDAVFAYEPLAAMAEPGRYRTLSNSVYAELVEPCPVGVSVIARDFERAHPETAARAAGALQEGIVYMGDHPREVASLLPRFTKVTPEMAARLDVGDLTLTNAVDPAALQRFIDLLYEIGEIPEKLDARRLLDPTR